MFLAPSRPAVYSLSMSLLLLLTTACNNDVSIGGKQDMPPIVAILDPQSQASFTTADNILFSGQVIDEDITGVMASWQINEDVYAAPLTPTGGCAMSLILPAGKHLITLGALDAAGSNSYTSLEIFVTATDRDTDGVADDVDCAPDDANYSVAQTWYEDQDDDGFGNSDQSVTDCLPPANYAATDTDCNDGHPGIYPGAPEICDYLDNNCDQVVDEAGAAGEQSYYADADGDGYGASGSVPITVCESQAPAGYVLDTGDCKDTDPNFAPFAPEKCGDTEDYNCNGLVGDQQLFADRDGDGRGDGNAEVTTDGDPCAPVEGASLYGDDCNDGEDSNGNPCVTSDVACMDLAASIYKDAPELCDTVDNDCDGSIDEADPNRAATWWLDFDGDSFGGSYYINDCPQPAGYVGNGDDCNDSDSSIKPTAIEVCDSSDTDEDCDSLADDADSSVDFSTTSLWYSDSDADSYGAGTATSACDAPTGMVADTTDCDDSRADVNPAAAEVCDPSNIDEDCDSVADDDDMFATGQTFWYQDNDADGYGSSIMQEVCDEPAGYSSVTNDCNDANGNVSPAVTTDTCDSVDSDCDGLEDQDAAQDAYEFTNSVDNDDPATAFELLNGGTTVTATGLNLINGETEDWYRVYFAEDNDVVNINVRFTINSLPVGCTAELYLWDEKTETAATCQPGVWPNTQPSCLATTGQSRSTSGTLVWTGALGDKWQDTFLLQISCPSYSSGQCRSLYSVTSTKF